MYFLTENNVVEPLPDHIDRVYTSAYIGILLRTQSKVDQNRIGCLPVNQTLSIADKLKDLNFNVTLIDSMQKPGSIMYLFESNDFGSILYAGKCAFSTNFIKPPLSSFKDAKKLDCLFVHDTPIDDDAVSPSAAVRQTIQYIRSNPLRNILIYEPCYRKDILMALRQKLQKPICVSENIMKHLEQVGLGSEFTLNQDGVRVNITEAPRVKRHRRIDNEVKVVLIPRSLRRTCEEIQCKKKRLEKHGFKVIIYREHCTISELRAMVNTLSPKRIVLITPTKRSWCFLGDLSNHMDLVHEMPSKILSPVIRSRSVVVKHENNTAINPVLTLDNDDSSVISQHTVLNTRIEIP